MENGKIKSFTDLIAWQKGHCLVLVIYKATKSFPKEEIYCLVSQMRRAVISITSNIAEGFSRKSFREKGQFFYLALGSLVEIQNQLLVAKDLGYLEREEFDSIAEQTIELSKLINGLIKSIESKNPA